VVSRHPGFEWVVSDGAADHRDAPDAVHGEALVLLSPAQALPGGASRLLDALRDPAAEIVVDESFVTGAPAPHELAAPDPRLPLAVSHAWFGGEEHVEGPTCAC
jgi:hypothetical protein